MRNLVWDTLHARSPTFNSDIDVVFFDAELPPHRDAELERQLHSLMPNMDWEVTNQAHVHLWFESTLDRIVHPLGSLEEGISTWPEFATCVGVFITDDDSIGIIAPYGLDDLFEMKVRHNPARASADEFNQRVRSKRFRDRWPRLTIEEA